MPSTPNPWLRGLFRAALWLYPRAFCSRFGPAMAQAFDDRLRAHRAAHGRLAAFVLGLRAIVNTASNGLSERWSPHRTSRAGDHPRGRFGTVGQDLGYAWRVIRRRPALSVMASLTLAIGIGASTAIFSLVDAALLRPLPYADAHELVSVLETASGNDSQVSLENLLDWKRESRLMAALTPIQAQSINLTGVAEPDRLRGGFVTSDFFAIVRVPRRSAGR